MAEQWIVNSEQTLNSFEAWLKKEWLEHKWLRFTVARGKNRSLDQNSLFHHWCRQAGEFFKLKENNGLSPQEQMKLVFKEMFLGREDILVGKTNIDRQLRRTSSLPVDEMFWFMTQVQEWSASKGLALESSGEYQELREKQNR